MDVHAGICSFSTVTPVWPLLYSPWGMERLVHTKPTYSRRKGEQRAQTEYTERWVIRLKTTKENLKHQLPPLQSGMLKPQPTKHAPFPDSFQATHLERQDWIHLYSVPPPPEVLLPTTEVSKQQRSGTPPLPVTSCVTRKTSPQTMLTLGWVTGPAEALGSMCLEEEWDAMGRAHTCESDTQLCHY